MAHEENSLLINISPENIEIFKEIQKLYNDAKEMSQEKRHSAYELIINYFAGLKFNTSDELEYVIKILNSEKNLMDKFLKYSNRSENRFIEYIKCRLESNLNKQDQTTLKYLTDILCYYENTGNIKDFLYKILSEEVLTIALVYSIKNYDLLADDLLEYDKDNDISYRYKISNEYDIKKRSALLDIYVSINKADVSRYFYRLNKMENICPNYDNYSNVKSFLTETDNISRAIDLFFFSKNLNQAGIEKFIDYICGLRNKNITILTILSVLHKMDKNEKNDKKQKIIIEKIINKLLVCSSVYQKYIVFNKSPDLINHFTYIYRIVLDILYNLALYNNYFEQYIAKYTSKSTASKFLFLQNNAKSLFRLNNINCLNDPDEGNTLLDFLMGEKQEKKINYTSTKRVFVGCFSYSLESLNQFRLYGHDEKKTEATGVSVLFKRDYFGSGIDSMVNDKEEKNESKLRLFRCVYIDPKTDNVVSVGHTEIDTMFRHYPAIIHKRKGNFKINDYEDFIDDRIHKLDDLLKKLKKVYKNLDNNNDIKYYGQVYTEKTFVDEHLLVYIRYLVKHTAFKEEQECRIVKVLDKDDPEIKIDDNFIYINYLEVTPSVVNKIILAPNFKNEDVFKARLEREFKVPCERCEHPYVCND